MLEPILTSFPGYPTVPVNFSVAPNGLIYVADKSGQVLLYSARGVVSSTVILNIRDHVMDFWDRGILGLTVDPDFANGSPYVYVLYTLDHDPKDPSQAANFQRWGGSAGGDGCPAPPAGPGGGGAGISSGDGCVVTARISRVRVDPNTGLAVGAEQVVFDSSAAGGWCEQYPSHSIGTLIFGPDGKLYAGAGDGASFDQPDYGQLGGQAGNGIVPANPCGDPSSAFAGPWRGHALSEPGAEGGSLRAQSVRSTVADGYQPYDGAIIRINKDGTIPSDNPLAGGVNEHGNDDPIVAYGLRNPFRFNFKPGTQDLWVGNVGAASREEVAHAAVGGGAGQVPNFGWPCFEGDIASTDFGMPYHSYSLCSSLGGSISANNAITGGTTVIPESNNIVSPLVSPTVAYGHQGDYWNLNTDAGCKAVTGGSDPGTSVTGGAFVAANDWPNALNGAYVFGDYSRQCVWALTATQQQAGGDPELIAKNLTPLVTKIAPVSIQTGPDGAIYILDIGDSSPSVQRAPGIYRIGTPSSPIATFTMTPTTGTPPLAVTFDATSSSVLAGRTVQSYSWDLDGDGIDDHSGPIVTTTYTVIGSIAVRLTVTDSTGASAQEVKTVMVGAPPVINKLTTSIPPAGYLEGDTISYTIDATDPNGEPLAYTIDGKLRHCDTPGGSGCHLHFNVLGNLPHTATGTFVAPGHAGYSYLELTVTATNQSGLASSRVYDLTANWLTLTVDTFPEGLLVNRDNNPNTAPYQTAQIGSPRATLSTPTRQTHDGTTDYFTGWADAPAAGPTRDLTPATGTIDLIAQFAPASGFTPHAPTRVLDTRTGTGAPVGIVAAASVIRVDLRNSALSANATAVLLNVTATGANAPGYVTVYPCSQPRPLASNVNYGAGQTVANLVQVAIDPSQQVCLYTLSPTNLVADLSGWFTPTGSSFTPTTPTRVLDTRTGTGAPMAPTTARGIIPLDLGAIAPAGSTAVVLNLTSTDATADGYITAYPCGDTPPLASNLNVRAGDTRPNETVVGLGTGTSVCLYTQTPMNLVADLLGWYGTNGIKIATQTPARVLDTRDGTGNNTRLAANSTARLDLSARALPGATAVTLNVTGINPTTNTYITVYPCGVDRPLASNLNLAPNDIRPNLVTVPLGTNNTICLYSQGPTDLVADLAGWALPN